MPSPHDTRAFSIGGLTIRWYALFILVGIVAGIWLIRWLAVRRGMNPDFVLDMAPWVTVGAILGARLYYVLLKWGHYSSHPGEAINIRLGGLTVHGALAAGVAIVAYLCWRAGQRFLAWADLILVGFALGQGVGRWGNWANQEAFGTPSNLPWAVAIDPTRRPAEYVTATHFHPTFLYESLFDLANALFLGWLVLKMPRSRLLREGDVLWTYFILYGIARFLIERIRTDSLYIGPLPAAYWLSFALITIGSTMLTLRHSIWPGRPVDTPDTVARGSLVSNHLVDRLDPPRERTADNGQRA